MKTTDFLKCSAIAVVAACSACAGAPTGSPPNPIVTSGYVGKVAVVNGMPVTAVRPNLNRMRTYASMLPELPATSKSKNYEYIINDYNSYASIFNYPKSDAQIGTINNVGGQGCTNVLYGYGKKIFWILAGDKQITEYQVPQKPLKTLSYTAGQPSSCAIDASGDLAIGILTGFPNGAGNVVIFKNASGSPTVIPTQLSNEFFDGYDPKGNLFADGYITVGHETNFGLVEIPKGSTTSEQITTSNFVEAAPGAVQWDGKYLTVEDQDKSVIYQYTIHGTKAHLKGTVTLSGAGDCAQTWIATGVVYCADAENNNGSVYTYPAGGSPLAILTGNFDLPLGTVAVEK